MDAFWRGARVGFFMGACSSLTYCGVLGLCLKVESSIRRLPLHHRPDAIDYWFVIATIPIAVAVAIWAKRWGDRNIEPLQYRGSQS